MLRYCMSKVRSLKSQTFLTSHAVVPRLQISTLKHLPVPRLWRWIGFNLCHLNCLVLLRWGTRQHELVFYCYLQTTLQLFLKLTANKMYLYSTFNRRNARQSAFQQITRHQVLHIERFKISKQVWWWQKINVILIRKMCKKENGFHVFI